MTDPSAKDRPRDEMRSLADCCERSGAFCGEGLYAEIERLRSELVRATAQRDAMVREVAHEQSLSRRYWVELWRAVNDRDDAPDYWLISQSDLICAVQDSDSAKQLHERAAMNQGDVPVVDFGGAS